jgi:hypothetical protein
VNVIDVDQPDGFQDVPWTDDVPDEQVFPDEASLLQPIAVLRSSDYDGFAPLRRQDLLSGDVYEHVFGELLRRVESAAVASEPVTS